MIFKRMIATLLFVYLFGIQTTVSATTISNTQIPIYRLYHPERKIHLYTKNKDEYTGLVSKGWIREGLGWNASLNNGDMVYRLYHPIHKYHFYTKNKSEYALLASRGWVQEGRAFNSYGNVPIYRLYNVERKQYLYTRNLTEYNTLKQRGWIQEGIAFYGLPNQTSTQTTLQPKVYEHPENGRYVDVLDFGADNTGQISSSEAINKALQFAHTHKAALFLSEGEFYITESILLNYRVSEVTGIFGAGKDKTKIRFDWNQHNRANNSGILIKELDNKFVSDLSVNYTGEYYRADKAYFGLIDGIQLDHTNNTTVQRVAVSGANRTGVRFDSIKYYAQNIKDSILSGQTDPSTLDLPKNNRILNSNIHHNRIAGIFGTFQRNFTVDGNTMSYNGHPNDGNAGYGFALGVGSYNDGIKITNNTTNNNYRKGIDVHDGDNILIQGNTSDSDRLFGIGIVARTFAMRNITIKDNTIKFNPAFHVFTDDTEPRNVAFKEFWGIDLQTNYDNVHHDNGQAGNFIIDNNTITGLQDNRNDTNVRVSAIRFGFHDHHAYNLTINNNKASGPSADNFIRVTSKSQAPGQLLISNNSAQFDSVALTFVGVGVTSLPTGSSLSIQQNFLNGNIIVHKTMP